MRNLDKYKGILPAFYACYDDKGAVSPAAVRQLTEYFIRKGVKGIYVNGSSGECIYLRKDERKIIIENVMEVVNAHPEHRLTVICHVACNNTEDSMELAAHAADVAEDVQQVDDLPQRDEHDDRQEGLGEGGERRDVDRRFYGPAERGALSVQGERQAVRHMPADIGRGGHEHVEEEPVEEPPPPEAPADRAGDG